MQRICKNCSQFFEITQDDLSFYDRVSPIFKGKKYPIPPPTLCPACRTQRRYSLRNERNLYRRTCDATGKPIISVYSPEKPYKIYEADAWWGDSWDGLNFGKDVDFTRPIFEQMNEILLAIPHIALYTVQCENSPYANQSGWSKNCYMGIVTDFSEDCYYAEYCFKARNCTDCMGMHESELCYECVDCVNCYAVRFSKDCSNCSDCAFCHDCRGCKNCFGCTGLRNKTHCWFNEQLKEEEWKKRMQELPYTPAMIGENFRRMQKQKLKMPHPHAVMTNCVDCTGNYLSNCKNTVECYDAKDLEDAKYCVIMPTKARDCYDVVGGGTELLYECFSTGVGYHDIFCWHCWDNVSELACCIFCMKGCHDLFGCVGLKKQQYCVLNKQYTKEEYEKLVPRVIDHMRTTGEWGEFFPTSMSPFCYNETIAQEHFPLTREGALKRGYTWRDLKDDVPEVEKVIPADKLPETIADIPDDILNWAIQCEKTKRPYRVIKQELAFYRQHGLPVPRLHPDERYKRRLAQRNPRKLWARPCMKCGKEMQTTYSPERPEIVYCEECYLKEVY